MRYCRIKNRVRQTLSELVLFTLVFLLTYIIVHLKFDSIPPDSKIDATLGDLRRVYNQSRTKSKNIFCIILTKPMNFGKQAKIVNKTWAFDCDKYFFIAKLNVNPQTEVSQPYPIIQPPNYPQEDYNKLTDKVFGAFKEIYLRYNDYNWYLKADDDTIVFMDHLREFLIDKNPQDPLTYGCTFKEKVFRGYQSGGAGYVLSREALNRLGKKLNENYSFCPNSGAEDYDLARCMRLLDVFPGISVDDQLNERFHPFNIKFHFYGHYLPTYYTFTEFPVRAGRASASETSISFHYMKPIEIYRLYVSWLEYRIRLKYYPNNTPKFTSILYKMLYSYTDYFII